jgi:hypothetical protein
MHTQINSGMMQTLFICFWLFTYLNKGVHMWYQHREILYRKTISFIWFTDLDITGCEYSKGELTYIHRSTSCGNNVHELTYGGSHVKCKAYQRRWLKLSMLFKLVKFY